MAEKQYSEDDRRDKFAGTYSADVEIGPDNKLYWVRDIKKGDLISIPLHMIDKGHRQ